MGKTGFTLVEMLVVVAIMVMLISMLAPAAGSSLDRAHNVTCRTRIRSLIQAQIAWSADNGGELLAAPKNNNRNEPWHTYMVSKGQHNYVKNNPIHWAVLYAEGYISDPKTFYCPGVEAQTKKDGIVNFQRYYGSVGGGPEGWRTSTIGNARTRTSYMFNPYYIRRMNAPHVSGIEHPSQDLSHLNPLPFSKQILVMDTLSIPTSEALRWNPHPRSGFNVGRVDGSVMSHNRSETFDMLISGGTTVDGNWGFFNSVIEVMSGSLP